MLAGHPSCHRPTVHAQPYGSPCCGHMPQSAGQDVQSSVDSHVPFPQAGWQVAGEPAVSQNSSPAHGQSPAHAMQSSLPVQHPSPQASAQSSAHVHAVSP